MHFTVAIYIAFTVPSFFIYIVSCCLLFVCDFIVGVFLCLSRDCGIAEIQFALTFFSFHGKEFHTGMSYDNEIIDVRC